MNGETNIVNTTLYYQHQDFRDVTMYAHLQTKL